MFKAWQHHCVYFSALLVVCIGSPQAIATQQPGVGKTPLAPKAEPLTIMAVGDIMLGSSYPDDSGLPPPNAGDLLQPFEPLLSSADVTFGNLEGPMLERGSSTKCKPQKPSAKAGNCFAFRVPTRYAVLLKRAGFTILNLANNHSSDFGEEGRASTRAVLRQVGVGFFGAGRGTYASTVVHVGSRDVGLIGFAPGDTSPNINDIPAARLLVEELKHRVQLVIVSFHGGAEGADRQHVLPGPERFFGEERGNLRSFTHAMVDAGADLVLGHGPHVLRRMEVYRSHLIVYSMGNFCTYGAFSLKGATALTAVFEFYLGSHGELISGKMHAGRQVGRGGPFPNASGEAIKVVRQLSRDDFGTSAVVIEDDGTFYAQCSHRTTCPSAEVLGNPHRIEPHGDRAGFGQASCQ